VRTFGKKVYAVRRGYVHGLYSTWPDCEIQVRGYSGAQFKSFKSLEEAEAYLRYRV
jgi:viroplasmin and RNaseH domain-containing protein